MGVRTTECPVWKIPGAEARLVELWTKSNDSIEAICRCLTAEYRIPVRPTALSNKISRMGLQGSRPQPAPPPEADEVETISLPHGYAYRGGRLLRDGAVLEFRQL
ncbi:hypothetical protein HCU64_06760 [Methylobacterium sp. C25]|uniref:hypothetical protein n=1 Tax=Methylobacterium sp. C25 TaxID=2721622 RepID=UPI001F1C6F4A|nr:hypothetical protein [Methylobacterium sp. C25]MCE4223447.1 hypothetical protein [Methylobacterium sp. C25]